MIDQPVPLGRDFGGGVDRMFHPAGLPVRVSTYE
jgi:hypothetical protein